MARTHALALWCRCAIALLLATLWSAAAAAEPQTYRPPTGFNGHDWQSVLGDFDGLRLLDAHSVLGYEGKGTWQPRMMNGYVIQHIEGSGAHFMGEYYLHSEPQPYRDTGTGASVLEIYYLFCAQALDADVPDNLAERLKLCGARVVFRSESLSELQNIADEDYRTNYDRILEALIQRHGEPDAWRPQARVFVETEEGRFGTPRKRRFDHWRWCGVRVQALYPKCKASIVLSFDARTGAGTVLYGTRPLFEFAEARHAMGDSNNPYYVLMQKHGQNKRHSVLRDRRELLRLGSGPTRRPMPEEMRRHFQAGNLRAHPQR